MAGLITSKAGGRFSVEVKHNFGPGNLDLLDFLRGLDDKLQRGVIRKMVNAAGAILVTRIKKEIATQDFPYSRLRTKKKKQLKAEGTVPLKYTITKRVWSKPRRGIIGCVVGPSWPHGAHGHLVEFGHKITGHRTVTHQRQKILRAGGRTIAHHFQEQATATAEHDIWYAMANKMTQALKAAGNPQFTSRMAMGELAQAAQEVF